jgi:hypothetical protein
MMTWLSDQNNRNAITLTFSSFLWLGIAAQTGWRPTWGRRRWLIVAWFGMTGTYFAFRATARFAHLPMGWLSLDSPLYEITGWVMNLLMIAVVFALRNGWYAPDSEPEWDGATERRSGFERRRWWCAR